MNKISLDLILKENKLSFTQQRRVVLEELYNIDNHLTADEIYFRVKKRMPRISIGTIYRNLTVLIELKLVDKIDTNLHTESHYEFHHDKHYHIICTKCLKIDDLEHYRALSIEPTAEKISGYKIKNHLVELYGICPNCQDNKTPQEESIKIPTIESHTPTPQARNSNNNIFKENIQQKEERKKFFMGRKDYNN